MYQPSWMGFAGDTRTYKLVEANGKTSPILGLVRVGTVAQGGKVLKESLLETVPNNSYTSFGSRRVLRGIGRVLVARLTAESYNTGGDGIVLVKAHPKAVGFYSHIGFKPLPGTTTTFLLPRQEANLLFEKATL